MCFKTNPTSGLRKPSLTPHYQPIWEREPEKAWAHDGPGKLVIPVNPAVAGARQPCPRKFRFRSWTCQSFILGGSSSFGGMVNSESCGVLMSDPSSTTQDAPQLNRLIGWIRGFLTPYPQSPPVHPISPIPLKLPLPATPPLEEVQDASKPGQVPYTSVTLQSPTRDKFSHN